MLTSCSSPAFTSTLRVIGERNAGFDSVISYVPGARSTGAGVTNGAFRSTVAPLATLRMLVTSPQGNAFSATRPGAMGTTDAATGGGAFFTTGSSLRNIITVMAPAITSTSTIAIHSSGERRCPGTG